MFGFNKDKKDEYEATMKRLEMMNAETQLAISGAMQQADSGSTILRNMQADIRELRKNIEHVSGFYKWVIHAYPESLVQYKALKDIEAAARGQDESEQVKQAV
jgi:uncharacterized protein YciI